MAKTQNPAAFLPGQVPSSPLEKIALSLSGGGYRAASFHLGGMSYLNHLRHDKIPLLQKVEMISTVSGGTIPGVVYTLMLQNGDSFEQCYHLLIEKLGTIDLVAGGIAMLNPENELNNKCKAKNLINAFAQQYDEQFTAGATLKDLDRMKGHLKAVVFNATEFTNAINFRFRNPDTYLKTGNDAFRIPRETAKEIKLSDIIASSSCFPGGFEPLLWPNDYIHDSAPLLEKLKAENDQKNVLPTGIMDGGIYDNQGVESIMLYKNGMDIPYFDLVIVSDVASPDMNAYQALIETPKKQGWKSLTLSQIITKCSSLIKKINLILVLAIILPLVIPLLWGYKNNVLTGICVAISLLSTSLLMLKAWLIRLAKSSYEKIKKEVLEIIPPFYFEKLSKLNVGEISYHRAQPLLVNRARSLMTLLSVIFLKVIRRLNYKRLYEHPNYDYRRSTVLIKELTESDWQPKHPKLRYDQEIGPKLKAVVEQAAEFGTTLWFTEDEKLTKMLQLLVVTGQATMCYNIKTYLEELTAPAKEGKEANGFEFLPTEVRSAITETLKSCTADWENFKSDPNYLYTKLTASKPQK